MVQSRGSSMVVQSDGLAVTSLFDAHSPGQLRARQTPERIRSLDGYRAIAATGVVVYHTAGWVGFLNPNQPGAHIIDNLGNFGVAVFFLLSGFLLFRPFALGSLSGEPQPSTAPFYIRRLLRIFPGYWLALVAWSLTVAPPDRVSGTTLGKFFLIDLYDPRIKTWQVGLGVSWTLTIELTFYLFLPIYACFVSRIARRFGSRRHRLAIQMFGLAALYTSSFVYRVLQARWDGAPFHSVTWLPAFFDWFALGMLLAVGSAWVRCGGQLPTSVRELAGRTWACWTCAALSYIAILVLKGGELHFDRIETPAQMSWRFFFQGLAAFFFLLPATLARNDGPAIRSLRSRPLLFLGTISYGIYLWHPVVMLWVEGLADQTSARARLVVLTIATLALTIPIAAVSYFSFELPLTGVYSRAAQRKHVRLESSTEAGHDYVVGGKVS